MGQEREKKILVPNSVPTRPGQENSKKKIPKNFKNKKKMKKLIPALFLSKTGWGRPRKRKKNLIPNSVPTQPELGNSKKKNKKIQKIKKVNSGIISIQNGLRDAEEERREI